MPVYSGNLICATCETLERHKDLEQWEWRLSRHIGKKVNVTQGYSSSDTGHEFRYLATLIKSRERDGHLDFLVENDWRDGERKWVRSLDILDILDESKD